MSDLHVCTVLTGRVQPSITVLHCCVVLWSPHMGRWRQFLTANIAKSLLEPRAGLWFRALPQASNCCLCVFIMLLSCETQYYSVYEWYKCYIERMNISLPQHQTLPNILTQSISEVWALMFSQFKWKCPLVLSLRRQTLVQFQVALTNSVCWTETYGNITILCLLHHFNIHIKELLYYEQSFHSEWIELLGLYCRELL